MELKSKMSPSSESKLSDTESSNGSNSSKSSKNESSNAPDEASTNEDGNTTMKIKDILPIRMISKVVPGFGRGSKDLGIPTANLSPATDDMTCKISFDSLPIGIYYGFARLSEPRDPKEGTNAGAASDEQALRGVYKAAISIGYNPCYKNTHKTIEPHLIAPVGHPSRNISACGETQFRDLYHETMRVSIVGYMRPELPFDGLEKLIAAIKGDIVKTEQFCDDETNAVVGAEKDWVLSAQDA